MITKLLYILMILIKYNIFAVNILLYYNTDVIEMQKWGSEGSWQV